MTKTTRNWIKLAAFTFACYAMALGFGLRTDQKPALSLWWLFSVATSTFTLMGLFSGIVLLGRGIAKCCERTVNGWRTALDVVLSGVYAAAILYCVLWVVAECVWLKHFGFTRDPIMLSIALIAGSAYVTIHAIVPFDCAGEGEPPKREKPNIAQQAIKWAIVVAFVCWAIVPFLAMQGRRNWAIVTRPESFAGTRAPAVQSARPVPGDRTKPWMVGPMASSQVFPKVPKSIYDDCESDIFPKIDTLSGARRIAFTIECNCYPENSFRIWLGRDADSDGRLAWYEIDFGFGWCCGEWVMRNKANGVEAAYPAKSAALRQRLEVRFDIDGNGACTGIDFLVDGVSLASDGQLDKFKPKDVSNWDMVRIVRNGIPEPDEFTSMTVITQ